MICPHCGYEHGWNGEKLAEVEGERGSFYYIPIDMRREFHYGTREVNLCACPNCKKTFID